jgi:hypothetical protein
MAQIWSPARVSTQKAVAWRMPSGARGQAPNAGRQTTTHIGYTYDNMLVITNWHPVSNRLSPLEPGPLAIEIAPDRMNCSGPGGLSFSKQMIRATATPARAYSSAVRPMLWMESRTPGLSC